MTIMPYDAKVAEYFKEIDVALKDTSHQLIATGSKTNLVEKVDFQSDIKLYKSVPDLLNDL